MTRPFALLALLAVAATSAPALAQNQFYFVARTAPAASIDNPGSAPPVVYLRWDTLEGQLPAEIAHFRLERDGALLGTFPARGHMNAAEITALYQQPGQRRRLLDTVRGLKLRALDAGRDFNAADYGAEIAQLLATDPTYGFLASRNDFNIARARYRAVVDTPGNGVTEYELLAVNAAGEQRRVGLVSVDPQQPQQVLPAERFRQVTQGDCDRVEAARDHFTVALAWQAPGADRKAPRLADALATEVFVAGYDLYRDSENLPDSVTAPAPRDIAAEARSRTTDASGVVRLDGLERVNDVLLPNTGAPDGGPAFLETRDELTTAGMGPGDRRTYYLVPRDFTGNYGPTQAIIVQVPDRNRPPAPWNVESFARTGVATPALEFSWPAVNLDNHLRENNGGREYCDIPAAQATGKLDFVARGESCATDVIRTLRLDVSDYRVYRFPNFELASRFRDADGDGFSDSVERATGAPNSQCNAELPEPAGGGFLLDPSLVSLETYTLETSGRQMVRFRDTVPAADQGTVYWYRIASRTQDGRQSELSAPIRGLFPDRSLPDDGDLTVETRVTSTCDCDLVRDGSNADWGFEDTIGSADTVNLLCDKQTVGPIPIDELADADGRFCAQQLAREPACASGPVEVVYPTSFRDPRFPRSQGSACTARLPAGTALCQTGRVQLVPSNCQTRELAPGESSEGDAEVVADPGDPANCVDLFRAINGQHSVVASSCGLGGGPVRFEVSNETFCGSAIVRNDSAQASKRQIIPCFTAGRPAQTAPASPQPISLVFGDTDATVQWRLPAEAVAATMVELTRQRDDTVVLASAPSDEDPVRGIHQHGLSVPPVEGPDEQWCMRLRTVARQVQNQDAAQSAWTPPLCVTRAGVTAPPVYLPWPRVPEAPEGEPLTVEFGLDGAATLLALAPRIPLGSFTGLGKACDVAVFSPQQIYPRLECDRAGEGIVRAATETLPNFVVYRQARLPDGTVGDRVQVSPRIDAQHWDRIDNPTDPRFTRRLTDPYLRVRAIDQTNDRYGLVYVDQRPIILGHAYRYQLVFFTDDNRLLEWRETPWLDSATLTSQAATQSMLSSQGVQP